LGREADVTPPISEQQNGQMQLYATCPPRKNRNAQILLRKSQRQIGQPDIAKRAAPTPE